MCLPFVKAHPFRIRYKCVTLAHMALHDLVPSYISSLSLAHSYHSLPAPMFHSLSS